MDLNEGMKINSDLNEVIEKLLYEKQLKVINKREDIEGIGSFFDVVDNKDQHFTVQLIQLSDNTNCPRNETKLLYAVQKANQLKNSNHQNIIKYQNQFQIQNYFCLQMEKFDYTIKQLLNKNNDQDPINKAQFAKIALQIFEVAHYLHLKGYVLQNLNLNNIFVSDCLQVKIHDFGLPLKVNSINIQQEWKFAKQRNQLFYYQPLLLDLKLKPKRQIQLNYQDDIWQIGIFLYYLSGASVEHILNFIQGLEQYKANYAFGKQLNTILINILIRKQDNLIRLSIPNIISQLSCVLTSFDDQIKITEENTIEKYEDTQAYVELLLKGIDQLNRKEYNEALITYNNCILLQPNNDILYTHLCRIQCHQRKYEEALTSSQKALSINPNNDYTYQNQGNIYSFLKKHAQALQCLLKAIEINPNSDQAYFNLANQYQTKWDCKKAIQYYQKAISLNSLDQDYYIALGILNYQYFLRDGAILCYKQALRICANQNCYFNIGIILYQQEKFDDCINYQKAVVRLNPEINLIQQLKLKNYKSKV